MAKSHPPVRVGLIGCGRISQQHFLSISAHGNRFALQMVCDIVPERAHECGTKYDVRAVTDYRKLIADPNVDLVAICTPNGLHYEMGIAAAEAGKHAIIEKPIAITSGDAETLIAAFHEAQRHLFPVLQVRYNPPIQAVRTLLKDGLLGRVYSANAFVTWSRPQKYYEGWRGTKELDGGSLLNQGIHYLDAMLYLLGPARRVIGKMATLAHAIEIEDHASAILTFESGAIGTFAFTMNAPRNLVCEIEIIGENGVVAIGGTALDELKRWEVAGVPQPKLIQSIPPNIYAGGIYRGSCPNHPLVYEAIGHTLADGKGNPIAKGADALRVIRTIEAIARSSECGAETNVEETL